MNNLPVYISLLIALQRNVCTRARYTDREIHGGMVVTLSVSVLMLPRDNTHVQKGRGSWKYKCNRTRTVTTTIQFMYEYLKKVILFIN